MRPAPYISMRDALASPDHLGGAIPGDSWLPWRTLLIAAMGEALTDEERALYTTMTGRDVEPLERVDELWGVIGRRGGKTRAMGTLGAYLATCFDWAPLLASGERGVLPILAASQHQAGRAFQHIRGIMAGSPELSELLDGEPTADMIRLTVPVDIEIRPANFRTVRSITAIAAICDEAAFWSIEGSANPDDEILAALRPALLTTEGMLAVISSPHAKKGVVYSAYRKHFGRQGDPLILVANGPSKLFNPTLPQRFIDRAYADDAMVASAEYGGLFRDDVTDFVPRDVVEACVDAGVIERPPESGVEYFGFVDPAGGSGQDAMTLAIAHFDGERGVLDLVRERKPPFSPAQVVQDFASDLLRYGCRTVTGDRWGGEFVREPFRAEGIEYALAEKVRRDLYRDLLPMLNSRQALLLDLPTLVTQIASLERRVARGGRESIDHPPNGHDDAANAVAGVLSLVGKVGSYDTTMNWVEG